MPTITDILSNLSFKQFSETKSRKLSVMSILFSHKFFKLGEKESDPESIGILPSKNERELQPLRSRVVRQSEAIDISEI